MSIYSKLGCPGGSDGKASGCNAGDLGSILGSGRSPGEGNGNPLQYSCLEIPWMEEPGGYSPWGRKELHATEQLHFLTFPFFLMVFPVVTYGCESWTTKKAEHERINALNCGAGEDSCESLGQQGDPTSPF